MRNLENDYYNPFFSHIYVEKAVCGHPRTQRILKRFPDARVIVIDHYKDVFCRRGQDFILQQRSQNLILAANRGTLLYKGAAVCQSFGNENFYYSSCMMNCVYDCEYCYLKGMYPSGNMVLFVNLEDIFDEIRQALKKRSLYLCLSYDTDMMAMERITGYVGEWIRFVQEQVCQGKKLKVEIRTKSADQRFWQENPPVPAVIYGITLSPQAVICAYEHRTPSLEQRIASAGEALLRGFPVRLCFDPMIRLADWQMHYDDMLRQVFERIDMEKLTDVSVGTFRISQDYLKEMRRREPYSAVAQYPYENDGGVYHYYAELTEKMERFLVSRLREKLPEEKIFRWGNEAQDEKGM